MKLITQYDTMQCGIACLAMICRHYGKAYSIDTLSQICHATTEGVSMLGISEAAASLGFRPPAEEQALTNYPKLPFPASSIGTRIISSFYIK